MSGSSLIAAVAVAHAHPLGALRRPPSTFDQPPQCPEEDEALTANVLLENLAAKATGVLALRRLLRQVETRLEPDAIEFVIAGSEEAVGDRYQRGGGNLAKARG